MIHNLSRRSGICNPARCDLLTERSAFWGYIFCKTTCFPYMCGSVLCACRPTLDSKACSLFELSMYDVKLFFSF